MYVCVRYFCRMLRFPVGRKGAKTHTFPVDFISYSDWNRTVCCGTVRFFVLQNTVPQASYGTILQQISAPSIFGGFSVKCFENLDFSNKKYTVTHV